MTPNTDTFEHWIRAHQAHEIDEMLTYLTEDVTISSAAGADMPPAVGREQAATHWQTIYTTFPDFRMEAVEVTEAGDTLFAEISHGGTMEGPMGPRQPTGKSYRLQGAFRFDFEGGRISSILSYWDTASMARQLGLVPPTN